MLRWFQGGGGRANPEKANKKVDGHFQELNSDQVYNPFTEVLVLTGGCISTIYQISIVDEKRFITASENGLATVWDAETGKQLMVLDHRRGERERVSLVCVLPLQPVADSTDLHVIMTADSMGVLHVWNIEDPLGEGPDQKEVTDHDGIIKCLVQFNQELICSGGSDLCLWSGKGQLLSKFSRRGLEEKSSIHSVLKLDSRHFGVVAASDYKSLAVYDINKETMRETDCYDLKFIRYLLSSHAQNICSLTSISANLFASGSRDGVVLLWSTSSLSAMKMFNCSDGMPRELVQSTGPTSSSLSTPTEIKHILVIGERYLFAAIGCGFRVYDLFTYEDNQGHPKPLASVSSAHQQPITCMEFLNDRAVLATASEDGTVRLWGRPSTLKRDNDGALDSQISGRFLIEEFLGTELTTSKARKKGGPTLPIAPMLLGELLLHASAVKVVLDLRQHGLVTCSTDNFIILWKLEDFEFPRPSPPDRITNTHSESLKWLVRVGHINRFPDAEKEREKRDFNMRSVLHGD